MFRKYFLPVFKVIGFVFLYFIAVIISQLVASKAGSMLPAGQVQELLGAFVSAGVAVLLVLMYLKLDGRGFSSIGISFEAGWPAKLVRGAAEGLIIMLLLIGLLLATGLGALRGFEAAGAGAAVERLISGLILYMFFVAFIEEMVTRGYMYHYLKARFTMAGAAVITSAVFAFMHIFNSNVTPLALFNIFLAGLVLNFYVFRDGSLWSAVGFHFGWNYTMGVIFSSPVSGSGENGIIKLSLKGYELLSGGAFGIEGGILCTAGLLIMAVYLLRGNPRKAEFLKGLQLRKNAAFVGILIVILFAYIITDAVIWMSQPVASDRVELNRMAEYENANDYTMELRLDTANKILYGQQKVSYINNSKEALNEIYFHIYPNAFSGNGGGIDIKSMKINGIDTEAKLEGRDGTLLRTDLAQSLQPGDRVEVYMEYEIHIPQKGGKGFGDRFGYGDNTYNLGNFFPIAAVYDENGWDKHLYDSKGDAFYSETGNFSVRITAPAAQVIAATGEIQSETASGKDKVWQIEAPSVRDFAFVASDMFKVREAAVGGIRIKSYASSAIKAGKALEIGAAAIRDFNREYGKYPYPACSIVQSDISGGMEYPNLVMIESASYNNIAISNLIYSSLYGSVTGNLEFVLVHELAHQWWYGIVGDNEYTEAWIDEALTQYSSLQYYRNRYGQQAFDRVYDNYIKSQYKSYLAIGLLENPSLDRPLDKFEENEYYILIYNKGTMMYKDLNDELGNEKFGLLQRALFDRYKFKVVSGRELIELTSEIAGKDMSGFFQKWLTTFYTGDEL